MKFDVCVTTLVPITIEFEEMIKREIPVNNIICSYVKPLGTARQELIDKVSTDWFIFIDTDVELLPGWFEKVWSMVDDHTGAVDGLWSYTVEPEVDAYQKAMNELARILGRKTSTGSVARAFTGDTLIRTDLVIDINIPPVPVFEDEYIKRHILRKGFEWRRTPEVVCLHHREMNIRQAYESGYYAYYLGMMKPQQAIKNLITIIPKSLYAALITGMWKIIPMQLNREVRTSYGCLTAWKRQDRLKVTPD